ncbi:DoxX [Listeria grayi]|uniref:DoxX family protein n=1 Tax=Listeria grayi FSL F6-1183 TaxID=1265827 RepID=A0A829R7P7_LISGR|nr:DoxX family protein [Listeria grayi]EUJ29273.1 hypothetical protein LMUR_04073 [Listeria grayi FSL F6-1183]MBC1922249.1 DoxX family protein [Listeria grayi]VEI32556.1 DoxX [Listeria grayi]
MKIILRAIIGLLFVYHGVTKLIDFDQTGAFFNQLGLNQAILVLVVAIEIIGGLALALGLLVPYVSILLIIVLAGAIFTVKRQSGLASMELEFVYIVNLLYLLATSSFSKVLQWKA